MKPLQHLTILDLSRVLACPFASMILAELGATVIKVEQPGAGDETRSFEPQLEQDSAYYFACNRSKTSITVNLRKPEGQAIIRELAQKVDVVVENFPAGNLARYGLDFTMLSSLNPKLIYVSCTGFGQTGPYAHKKGYDTVFQAMGGLMSLTGEKGGGPVKPGLPVADLTSGLWVAIGILAMVAGREQTGKGAHLDFSMLDGQVSLLTLAAARYFALGEVPPRLGTEHPGRVPSATFRCSDGKFAHITASDQHWEPLCRVLNLKFDVDLSTNEARVEHRDLVMSKMTEEILKVKRATLLQMLDEVEVPIGPVNDVAEILADPHVRARGLVGSFDYPGVGEFKALGLPYKFLGWDNPQIGTPPTLGADTETVLAERLGYSREKNLRAEGSKSHMSAVLYSVSDGVATITLNRPESRNALNLEMCDLLLSFCQALSKSEEAKLVLVKANGPVFCAGADLKERQGMTEAQVRERRMKGFAAYAALEALPMPSIAVLQGPAVGSGCEIAGSCDFIIATLEASFRTPEAIRGTVGATQRLPRILGKRLAKDLMFTGRILGAEEAKQAGLISRLVVDVEAEIRKITTTILEAPQNSLRLAKRCIDRGVELDPAGALQEEIKAIEEQLAAGQWMGKK